MANAFSRLLRKSPLMDQLMQLEGNAKWCVLCEPFWAITNALYVAYAVEYRKAIIGLDNANLGTLLGTLVTIQLAAQFISSFLGGVITDKLGRRKTCYYFDLLSGVAFGLRKEFLVVCSFHGIGRLLADQYQCLEWPFDRRLPA